jgi:hypothetical protein
MTLCNTCWLKNENSALYCAECWMKLTAWENNINVDNLLNKSQVGEKISQIQTIFTHKIEPKVYLKFIYIALFICSFFPVINIKKIYGDTLEIQLTDMRLYGWLVLLSPIVFFWLEFYYNKIKNSAYHKIIPDIFILAYAGIIVWMYLVLSGFGSIDFGWIIQYKLSMFYYIQMLLFIGVIVGKISQIKAKLKDLWINN